MVFLVSLIPLYVFIPEFAAGPVHVPELKIDHLIPLQPVWALIYGAVYAFLILLPILVVRQHDLISRTVFAYLTVWLTAYIFFLFYPTVAPRPAEMDGDGFAAWILRSLYSADPPYNCFPSLHVAHSFVSAFAISRVHRRIGAGAIVCASLVGLSTLFTKQHYVADVIAGIVLASGAYLVFLRGHSRDAVPEIDRRVAPLLTLIAIGVSGLGVAALGVVYLLVAG